MTSDQIWVSSNNLLIPRNPVFCRKMGVIVVCHPVSTVFQPLAGHEGAKLVTWGESQIFMAIRSSVALLAREGASVSAAAFHFGELYWLLALPAEPFVGKLWNSLLWRSQFCRHTGKCFHNTQESLIFMKTFNFDCNGLTCKHTHNVYVLYICELCFGN